MSKQVRKNVFEKSAKELIEMAKEDQKMRIGHQSGKIKFDFRVDLKNTKRLKKIIEKFGWPTISKVGKEASNAAWLLVQHADNDPKFQQKCLLLMLKVKVGDINLQNIAYLTDSKTN